MQTKVVTTLGPNGWERYGKRFVESFKKFWPTSVELEVWHHDLNGDVPQFEGVTFRALEDVEAFRHIKRALGDKAKDGPSLGYAFKAIALATAVTPELDWIAFVDADTETMRPVDQPLLDELFDENFHLTYLYRKSVQESEGSWFAFQVRTVAGASLLADYYGLYSSLEAYKYQKNHDNFVLDRLVMLHRAHGLAVKNLAPGSLGLDAFHQSPLGQYMIHYKGPNKDTIADPGMMVPGRYATLCDILKHSIGAVGRADIVEVGTWNGSRAVQMAEAAFATGQQRVSYVGFDTFEGGNDRAHEGHTKPDATYDHVAGRLENYSRLMARSGRQFDWALIKGNSMETMPAHAHMIRNASFAYIDGGHSYETTKSDYENLAHVPYIVFDDVIQLEEDGAPEGPRRVLNEIEGKQKHLHTSQDGYAGLMQSISQGIVVAEGLPMPQLRQQLRVKPVDSVDKSEQFQHIADNTQAMSEWVQSYQAHERHALLVSAGPTLKDFLPEIRKRQAEGAVIFTVKHAFPILKAAGITPDYTVLLDPRPVEGVSTHGVVRTDLFAEAGPEDTFLLATMTHPSVRQYLEGRDCKLVGWHAQTGGTTEADLPEFKKGLAIGGGTCAATRLQTIAFVMGFRRLHFFGYDFFYPKGTDASRIKQSLMTIRIGELDQEFVTTGELVAAMQDLGVWNKWMLDNRLSVWWYGDGCGAAIWNTTIKQYHPLPEYPTK